MAYFLFQFVHCPFGKKISRAIPGPGQVTLFFSLYRKKKENASIKIILHRPEPHVQVATVFLHFDENSGYYPGHSTSRHSGRESKGLSWSRAVQKWKFSFELKGVEREKAQHFRHIWAVFLLVMHKSGEKAIYGQTWGKPESDTEEEVMGKGDLRSKRGKIKRGTTGNCRPKRKNIRKAARKKIQQ